MKTMAYLHATDDRCVSMERHNYVNARELVLRTDAEKLTRKLAAAQGRLKLFAVEGRLSQLCDSDLNAILAGLRLLQQVMATKQGIDEAIFDIASDCGTKPILLLSGIDDLCERLNKGAA